MQPTTPNQTCNKTPKLKKHLFACWNTTHYFGTFLFFATHLFLQQLCLAETTTKIVFQQSTAFLRPLPKIPFSKTMGNFRLYPLPAETCIFVVFSGFFGRNKRDKFAKADSVDENALFSPSPNTNSVLHFFKQHFWQTSHFFPTHPPKHYFLGIFEICCLRLLCFSFSTIEKAKTKHAIFFSKTSF